MHTDWSTDRPTTWPADSRPVRLALIGAGVFARDAHLPSLLRRPDRFEIAAVYSRSAESAQALARAIPYPVAQFTDLDALLARPDIEAVDIVLPIPVMPTVIAQALAAGKHVLSEKPIAPTVAAGRALLAQSAHRSQPQSLLPVWMVGENWRYEEAFRRAAQLVHERTIGAPVTCSWAIHSPMTPSSKYYHTAWRRDSSIPGGLLLDGGVHHAAILRLILGEIVEVRAVARQVSPDLHPLDTLSASLRFASGALGNYLVTYATAAPWPAALHIAGSSGALRVLRDRIELIRNGATETIACTGFDGVEKELLAFAEAIRTGAPHLNPPEEALADLAVIEAMLIAASTGEAVNPTELGAVRPSR